MTRSAKAVALLLSLVVSVARGGNGLNDIGYGSESSSLAGADLAVARDTTALNTNPAGLTQIKGQVLDLLLEPYAYNGNEHTDSIGNSTNPDNWYGSAVGGGYARRLAGRDLVIGVGLFFQGGAGLAYRDLRTPFGTRDELSGLFGSVKIAPGFAWEINDRWSVGLSSGLLYSSARQKFFPATSTAAFSGFRIDDLKGFSANLKVGLQYRPSPQWVLALGYTSKGKLKLEDGRMRLNNTGSGGGFLTYEDVSLEGLAFAEEFGTGVLFRAGPATSIVGEVTLLNWSAAMKSTELRARRPDSAAAPPELVIRSPLDWRDHYLVSVGLLHQLSPATELRAGLSFARNPVPSDTLSPTFALIGETSYTAGISHRLGPDWRMSLSGVYQPPKTQRYNSPLTGPSSERWEVIGIYLTFSRRW